MDDQDDTLEGHIYTIRVNGVSQGYCLTLENTMKVVKHLKTTMLTQSNNDWGNRIYSWDEWKPVSLNVIHHFVLESRPRNNILQYSKKEHDIIIEHLKLVV